MNNSSPLRILFYGTPDFAGITLTKLLNDPGIRVPLVITQPDRPAGRGGKLTPSPVKVIAASNGIPCLQPKRIKKNAASFISEVNAFGPFDVGVVVAFGQILPKEVLEVPRRGSVNIHASLLPRWRGAAPIQRAIISGDKETGIALMAMDEGLDTGAVYSSKKITIEPTDTFGTLHDKLGSLGAALLCEKIRDIVSGALTPSSQAAAGVTYADKISNEEAKLDWSKNAEELSSLIRGINPFPGAFTFFQGKRLKIHMAVPGIGDSKGAAAPGEVVTSDKGLLLVQCGSGVLSLKEVQLEGKKRITVEEFLRGAKIEAGMSFGEQQ